MDDLIIKKVGELAAASFAAGMLQGQGDTGSAQHKRVIESAKRLMVEIQAIRAKELEVLNK